MVAVVKVGGETMEVRIERLGPLRVAAARAVSTQPETDAFNVLTAWAKARGLADQEGYRVFGSNNPNPTPGNPVYGYEVWMTVGPEVQPEGQIAVKDFPGGLYAVARIQPKSGDEIPPGWQALHRWVVSSGRRHGKHQWLEEHLAPLGVPLGELEMDLYYPLAE